MKITYDPAKRQSTLEERGLDFADAAEIFKGVTLDRENTRFDYGESRIITIGFLRERMVVIVWIPRGAARHIISMRKANAKEQRHHRQRLGEN